MSPKHAFRQALFTAGALTALLVISACSSGDAKSNGTGTNFVTSSETGISTVPKGKRQEAGSLAGETLEGTQLDVANLKGNVVVLNLWGSWCPPCRAETPHFVKVSKEVEGKGVKFVGINTRDFNKQPALAFEEDFGVPYPSLYDPRGSLILKAFPKGTVAPKGIPTTVVLDREGRIAARSLQALDEERLHSLIDPVIAEKE
ncbi:TlpA disulfide reductase family protein [Streptomyces sp. ITFR-16]|uniref:TlpA family protein disulfide reductase n=1 Tax=Streptomyces sp. ITFR-16 TaxID=3075198 RepID=UPI00288B0500|nr:TlpA disulfide reductase family protein [Streptomyces sp. ITFR-16]WNI24169.1 TlpA disulfide reductase family protein [Streptomyces sp. ITFR-16]